MFSVTSKSVYGLTAIVALARSAGQGPRQIKEIAESYEIPQHYLEQILASLKKAGFVRSYRGARGGYAMAKRPDQITVHDILVQLEGELAVVPDQKLPSFLSFFWKEIEQTLSDALGKTIADLAADAEKLENRHTCYSI